VNVGAKDKATNKAQSIRIQANGGLSDADIDKMLKDAEAHKAEDEKRKLIVEARNHADATLDSSEKALASHGDKVPAPVKAAVETALSGLEAVKDGDDLEAIHARTQTLIEAAMKLGEAMYAAHEGEAGSQSRPADDNVVDAEFEEA
jgi:molecular chaperone DnaK